VRLIAATVNGCPVGKHPDSTGLTRWCGVTWYGFPYPLRLWRHHLHFADVPVSTYIAKFPGCGCVRRLKDLWTRAVRFARSLT
jgi:hypothetical protein